MVQCIAKVKNEEKQAKPQVSTSSPPLLKTLSPQVQADMPFTL